MPAIRKKEHLRTKQIERTVEKINKKNSVKNKARTFAAEVCRIRNTGVDSGRSSTFTAGVGAGSGVDFFD